LLTKLMIRGREGLHLVGREIFIHYPDGIGRSKLKLPPPASHGTMRNLNTGGQAGCDDEGAALTDRYRRDVRG